MKNKLPNFLIVGAQKSGTTSLYNYLKQHYDIFMPERLKEPKFFVSPIFKKIDRNQPLWIKFMNNTMFELHDYLKLFEEAQKEKAIGESSVTYLYYYETATMLIKKHLGNIICIK